MKMQYKNRDWFEIFFAYYSGESTNSLSQRYEIHQRTIQRTCKRMLKELFECEYFKNNETEIKNKIREILNYD